MRSTWLLIKSLRGYLVLGMILEVAWGLGYGIAMGMNSVSPYLFLTPMPFFIGIIVMVVGGLPRRFYSYPFPVSPRQLAWIPMGILGMFWFTSLAGHVMAVAYLTWKCNVPLSSWYPQVMATLDTLPIALFFVCLFQGPVLAKSWMIICLAPTLLQDEMRGSWMGPFESWYRSGWPGVLGMALLLFLAAPAAVAATDRTGQYIQQAANGQSQLLERVRRPRLAAIFVETVANTPILLLAVVLFAGFVAEIWDPLDREFSPVLFGVTVSLTVAGTSAAIGFLRNDYRRLRASGFGRDMAAVLLAIRSTLISVPLTRAFGVKSGQLIHCPACGKSKFAWQPACPHCADVSARPRLKRADASPIEWRAYPWGGYAVRFIILIYLGWLAFTSYSNDRKSEFLRISMEAVPKSIPRETIIRDIRSIIEAETPTWFKSLQPSALEDGRFPPRTSILVAVDASGRLVFCCRGPRWEASEYFVRAVAEDIVRRVQDRYVLKILP